MAAAFAPPSAATRAHYLHHNCQITKQRPLGTFTSLKIKIARKKFRMKGHMRTVEKNTASIGVFSGLAQESGGGKRQEQERGGAPRNDDTRIHWDNENEGWIGGGNSGGSRREAEEDDNDILARKLSDLLKKSSDSHYQFLGVSPNADLEEIKSAYRRLSKEYHPDTTTLPLKSASEMFMKLRDIYDVLSDCEKRKFYDWSLAQEVASREAEKMRVKLKDPFIKDFETYVPMPDMVDRLGGKNMKLSDQAMSALTFDILIIVFAICCIIYVAFFKET